MRHCVRVVADRYEFRIKGRVGETVAASFDQFDTEIEPALLERIQGLGLELVEIRQVTRE